MITIRTRVSHGGYELTTLHNDVFLLVDANRTLVMVEDKSEHTHAVRGRDMRQRYR